MTLLFFILLVNWSCYPLVQAFSAAGSHPNVVQKVFLKVGRGKKWREAVVERYFDGVQNQDRDQIVSCFDPNGTKLRDVCGVSNSERIATPDDLGERCMEFLAAHPDTTVKYHYSRGKSRWVFTHWYEEGTFQRESRGIPPDFSKLDVEGQTRFLVNDDLKITEMVVTRTFSDWEKKLQAATRSS